MPDMGRERSNSSTTRPLSETLSRIRWMGREAFTWWVEKWWMAGGRITDWLRDYEDDWYFILNIILNQYVLSNNMSKDRFIILIYSDHSKYSTSKLLFGPVNNDFHSLMVLLSDHIEDVLTPFLDVGVKRGQFSIFLKVNHLIPLRLDFLHHFQFRKRPILLILLVNLLQNGGHVSDTSVWGVLD